MSAERSTLSRIFFCRFLFINILQQKKKKQFNIQCNFFFRTLASHLQSINIDISQVRRFTLNVNRSIPDAQLFLHAELVPQSAHGLSQ